MKYFIGNHSVIIRDDIHGNTGGVMIFLPTEVCPDKAREIYMIWGEHNGYENDALEQLPLAFWRQGKKVPLRHYDIWGEDIGESELFKRRLNGSLAKDKVL